MIDEEVAAIYANIKNDLKNIGFTIPENDIWIAAIAQKNGLSVAIYDAHFQHIKTIEVINLSLY